jgi:aminoglycoside 3'-phosphotransferase-2
LVSQLPAGAAEGPAGAAVGLAASEAASVPLVVGGDVSGGQTSLEMVAAALRALHRLPAESCPFDTSNEALLAEAGRRVEADAVDAAAFDAAYRRYRPDELLVLAEASRPAPGPVAVVHGRAHLALLEVDPVTGSARWSGLEHLGVGDPYRDLATLTLDLVAGGAASEILGTFFAAYGIEHPDVLRLDFHVLVDQLLR